MANERCQPNRHKWQTSVDCWASSDIGEVLSLFYKSLYCFTIWLLHSATIFCCYIYVHVFVVWNLTRLITRLERVFFNSIWWGALSSNVFTICAVYWSLGRRGYFGVSNGVLVVDLPKRKHSFFSNMYMHNESKELVYISAPKYNNIKYNWLAIYFLWGVTSF